ncbi:hypothetical protein KSP40_PGU001670 [Platanthera guangdongensis]|uniref:Late embryogenesis abundant protein LEA-2 subgroup domain-containing protein n=1 Tax=Platanthera guangdongensis TaxID=2320717 RepID=A0ABR2M0P6_9ASPA
MAPQAPTLTSAAPRRRYRARRLIAISIFSLFVLLALIILIFYLSVRPRPISFSVEDARIHNFNLSSSDTLNVTFHLALLADNHRNHHLSIYYDSLGVAVWYADQMLAFRELPPFHQPTRNVTRLVLAASAVAVPLFVSVADGLKHDRSAGEVGVDIRVRARVRFKVGAAKTKHYVLRAYCSPVVVRFWPAAGWSFQKTYCDVDV